MVDHGVFVVGSNEVGIFDDVTRELANMLAATGKVTMVSNVAAGLREEAWRKDALARDYLSVLSIPLVYNDLTHGLLTVYTPTRDAFDDTAKAILAELGETIASALSAIERKNALLTTSMTRVEFAVDDSAFVLSRLGDAVRTELENRDITWRDAASIVALPQIAERTKRSGSSRRPRGPTAVADRPAGSTRGSTRERRDARPRRIGVATGSLESSDAGPVYRDRNRWRRLRPRARVLEPPVVPDVTVSSHG